MREHTKLIAPPRALWVSFPLGRPFGIPGDAGFQRSVLRAVLDLLDAGDGPVLVDYDGEIPERDEAETEGWACPVTLAPPPEDDDDLAAALISEFRSLLPWYDLSRDRRDRTGVGASGLSPETATAFVGDFLTGFPENPRSELPVEETFKQCVEDLKSFYAESATAQPGAATPDDIGAWLWNETVLGQVLLTLHQHFLEGSHAGLRSLAEHALIPRVILEAHGLERPSKPGWHTPQ